MRIETPAGGFRRIDVLRLSSLGDVVLTLPVVQALGRAFPAARLVYWVKQEYADLVRFDPAVSHVRILERDARRLEDVVAMGAELEDSDLIVDLHGNLRTRVLTFRQRAPVLRARSDRLRRARWVHARWSRPAPGPTLERYAATLAPLGIPVPAAPRQCAGEEAEAWAECWMEAWKPDRPPLAICPWARHFTKRWPEERWLSLHERLVGAGEWLLYFSLEAERRELPSLAERVARDARARWCTEPLPRMAALLGRCRGAVCCDSGLMHLAAARGIKVVALFGSTAPELGFAPAGTGHVVLCRHELCQPCTLHGRRACPKRHFRCMLEIQPEEVAGAATRIG